MVRVDPHEASLDLGRYPVRPRQVLCPDTRTEAVLARVGELDAFTLALPVTQSQKAPHKCKRKRKQKKDILHSS